MIKRLLATVLALSLGNSAWAAKTRVAVLDLQAKNAPPGLTLAISDLLRVELIRLGAYEVVDRENMNLILKEQAFQQTGCTSAECAVEVGQILDCQKMFVGSLAQIGKRFFLSIQRVDVETARVDYANSMEANDEEALPETAKVLAGQIVKSGTVSRRVKAGDVTEGRRLFYELGGILMPKLGYKSWTNQQTSVKYDRLCASPMVGVRFYPRSVYWLGLGCFVAYPGTNFSEPTDSEQLIDPEVRELKTKSIIGSATTTLLGCELFFDMTGPTKWARRRLQIMLAAGLMTMGWEETVNFPAAGQDLSIEGSLSQPFAMVALDLRYRIVQAMLGGFLSSSEVSWLEHSMPYSDPVAAAKAGQETAVSLADGGAVMFRLSVVF